MYELLYVLPISGSSFCSPNIYAFKLFKHSSQLQLQFGVFSDEFLIVDTNASDREIAIGFRLSVMAILSFYSLLWQIL